MSKRAAVLVTALLIGAASAEAQKIDTIRSGPALPPRIETSENTPINYVGGVPPLFTGALDADDSLYNRVVDCTSLSAVGTAVAFDTITITNNSPGTANMVVTSSLVGGGACGNPNDSFFTLYTTFNPATPLANCLAANDDISGATNRCSTLSFAIPVGQTRVVVVSSFNNASSGGLFSYQINFTGTTPVELIDISVERSGGR